MLEWEKGLKIKKNKNGNGHEGICWRLGLKIMSEKTVIDYSITKPMLIRMFDMKSLRGAKGKLELSRIINNN